MQRHDRVGNLFVRRINILQPLNEQGTVTGHPVAHSLAEAVHTWPTDVIRLLAQGADANARVEGLPLLHYFCGLKKTHVIAALLAGARRKTKNSARGRVRNERNGYGVTANRW
ncbi:MAG: hypothetical protein ACI8W8_000640 [Rhodothermales bacterium]|jgi:hypothetical protein